MNINDEWFTAHPNGKEHKGRHIYAEEGESKADAIKRKYPNAAAKKEKVIVEQKSHLTKYKENQILFGKSANGEKEIKLSDTNFTDEYLKKHKKDAQLWDSKTQTMVNNPYYNAEKAFIKQEQKEKEKEAIKNYKLTPKQQAELNALKENPHEAFIQRQKSYHPGKYDNMDITQDKKDIDINGYVTYYDVPMTKAGVFPYLGKTISPDLEPDRVYNVLRPIEELTKPETLKSLEAIPFVIDHTMIGEGFTPPEDKGIEGTTLKNVKVNGGLISNDLTAYTDRCKQAIDNGKRDLSMGYRCRYELTPGEYQGQHYDAIQRDIIFNHIALVDEGRMGAECRVTDSAIVYDSLDIKELHNKKELKKMAQITLDEDLKEEIKEEIKKELLDGGAVIEEKKEDIIDEAPAEAPAEDADEDKRKLIDEIGGMLKDKVDDELIRTIMQKAEELAYKPSETGANDECGEEAKDEEEELIEKKEEKKTEGLSMDEAIKYIAKRDDLISRLKPVIGDHAEYKKMTVEQVVKYGCDKLDIPVSLRGLEGYLTASEKHKKTFVTVAKDSAFKPEKQNAGLNDYLNGK